jgi:hypothetical protein
VLKKSTSYAAIINAMRTRMCSEASLLRLRRRPLLKSHYNNAWSYSSTPPIRLHGVVLS